MSNSEEKKLKKIEMPHTYIIIFFVVIVAAILTYVIPAGKFAVHEAQYEDLNGNIKTRTVPTPGTFEYELSEDGKPLRKGISIFVSCGSGFCQVSLSWYLSICGIGGWQEDVWSQCSIEHGSKRSKFSQRSSRFFFLIWAAPSAGNTLAHLCLILYMEVNSSIFCWDR